MTLLKGTGMLLLHQKASFLLTSNVVIVVHAGDNEADGDDGSELGLCYDAGEEACSTSGHPSLC